MARLFLALLGLVPVCAFAEKAIPSDSVTDHVSVRETQSSDPPPGRHLDVLDYVRSYTGGQLIIIPDGRHALASETSMRVASDPVDARPRKRHWLFPQPVREEPMYWVNLAVHGWDIYQTCQFKDRNQKEVIAEWAIGTRPTCHDTMLAGVGGAVLMHFTDRLVSRRWPRAGWVLRNAFVGFRINLSNDNRRRRR